MDDKFRAEETAREFRREIERHLKRFSPSDYLPFATTLLNSVLQNPDKMMAKWPPHFIIHSMEANCAYHRGHRNEPVSMKTMERLFKVYNSYDDPAQLYLLKQPWPEPELILMEMARQQFIIQHEWNAYDVARGLLLFQELPLSGKLFADKFGITFDDWIRFCVALSAAIIKKSPPLVDLAELLNSEVKLFPDEIIPICFGLLSQTIEEVQDGFRQLRLKHTSPLLELQLPSLLINRPLVQLRDKFYVVTNKQFLLFRAAEGLYDLCTDKFPDTFGKEFGKSFERYMGLLLKELPDAVVIMEGQLETKISGKVCDYLVAMPDIIVLIECKAVEYRADLVTRNALAKTSSTARIAEGFTQLSNTAVSVKSGAFQELIDPVGSRPIIGLVVTYRHIYFANGDAFTGIVLPLVQLPKGVSGLHNLFSWNPQILDIVELEYIIQLARFGESVSAIISDKLSKSFVETGDWISFLGNKLKGRDRNIPLLNKTWFGLIDNLEQKLESQGFKLSD